MIDSDSEKLTRQSNTAGAVMLFLAIVFALFLLIAAGFTADDCNSSGGVLVNTITGYKCMHEVR